MKLYDIFEDELNICFDREVQLPFECTIRNERFIVVPVNIVKIAENDYSWRSLSIPKNKYNYDDIVDFLIKMVYSDQSMFAIINNYLLDPDDDLIVNEFKEMQEVRAEAKQIAKAIISL